MKLPCLFAGAILSLFLISCGGGSSPTAPTGSTTPPASTATTPATPTAPVSTACRTGLASYRIVTTSPSVTSTVNGTCTMNAAQTEGTCTNVYTDTLGGSSTSVSVTRHTTKADVVDEVSVVPPRMLALGTTTTLNPGSAATVVNAGTIIYDSQRRPVTLSNVSSSGQTSTTTYTAWDSSGRPTAGATVSASGSIPVNYAYNDATRTQSTTNSGITCTQTFDANGNPLLGTCSGSVATFTTLTTQQVCK